MCDMNCLNCKRRDCENDVITDAERKTQDAYDKACIKEHIPEERKALRKGSLKQYDYNHSDKGRENRKRYEHTDKGKARAKRYEQTEKGKERQKRYAQTEKGKAVAKKKQQKKVASGKNAEYCRRYYKRKKVERERRHEQKAQ